MAYNEDQKITLSGFAGSGKSTVGKILADRLACEFISVGNYSRKIASDEYHMTINEFQDLCKKDPSVDSETDQRFKDYCNQQQRIIVDYRLGFKFVNPAFHVLMKVSDKVAYQRINDAARKHEETDLESIQERNRSMRQRFLDTYGVDFTDETHYNLVVDTDKLNPFQIAALILEKIKIHE